MKRNFSKEKALDYFSFFILIIGISIFLFYLTKGFIWFGTGAVYLICSLGLFFFFRVISEISRSLKISMPENKVSTAAEVKTADNGFKIGDLVVNVTTDKQMRIREINPGTQKYSCYTNGGMTYEGDFDKSELKSLS